MIGLLPFVFFFPIFCSSYLGLPTYLFQYVSNTFSRNMYSHFNQICTYYLNVCHQKLIEQTRYVYVERQTLRKFFIKATTFEMSLCIQASIAVWYKSRIKNKKKRKIPQFHMMYFQATSAIVLRSWPLKITFVVVVCLLLSLISPFQTKRQGISKYFNNINCRSYHPNKSDTPKLCLP